MKLFIPILTLAVFITPPSSKNNFGNNQWLLLTKEDFKETKKKLTHYAWAREFFLEEVKKVKELSRIVKKLEQSEFKKFLYQKSIIAAEKALTAAKLYHLTQKPEYLEWAKKVLLSFGEIYPELSLKYADNPAFASPYLKLSSKHQSKIGHNTLDEAQWLFKIAFTYDLILDELTQEEKKILRENLLLPSARLILNAPFASQTTQAWFNLAMGLVGFLTKNNKLIHKALDASTGYYAQLEKGINEDGRWVEGSWWEHYFALQALNYLAWIGERAGFPLYYNSLALRKMFDFPFLARLTKERLPNFDLCLERQFKPSVYEYCWRVYNDRVYAFLLAQNTRRNKVAFYYGQSSLPLKLEPISLRSLHFKESGVTLLRKGKLSLAIDYGAHSAPFGHYDKLGFIWAKGDEILGIEGGSIAGEEELKEGWLKQTIAHNTIVVDRKSQNEAEGELVDSWETRSFSGVLCQVRGCYPGVVIKRFCGLTQDYLVIIDKVESEEEHVYDWVYRNRGEFSTPSELKKLEKREEIGEGWLFIKNPTQSEIGKTWRGNWKRNDVVVSLKYITSAKKACLITGEAPYIEDTRVEFAPLIILRQKVKQGLFIAIFDIYPVSKTAIYPNIKRISQKFIKGNLVKLKLELTNGYQDEIYVSFKGNINLEMNGFFFSKKIGFLRRK